MSKQNKTARGQLAAGERVSGNGRALNSSNKEYTTESGHGPVDSKIHVNGSGALHIPDRNAPMVKWALFYASNGWYVFPCHNPVFDADGNLSGCTCEEYKGSEKYRQWLAERGKEHTFNPDYKCPSPGKHPRLSAWEDKATTDKDQIRRWWRGWPNANIGLACGKSGVLTLDRDTYKDRYRGEGLLTDTDEETVRQITGSGGNHLLYAMPADKSYGNQTGELPEGIDIRGHGGLILLAPSLHPSGHHYQWENDYAPTEIPLQPTPEWLCESLDSVQRRWMESVGESDVEAVNGSAERVEQLLGKMGIEHTGAKPWMGAGRVWSLDECPFSDAHFDGAYIAVLPDGAISASCHHTSCKHRIKEEGDGRGWNLLKRIADPAPEDDGWDGDDDDHIEEDVFDLIERIASNPELDDSSRRQAITDNVDAFGLLEEYMEMEVVPTLVDQLGWTKTDATKFFRAAQKKVRKENRRATLSGKPTGKHSSWPYEIRNGQMTRIQEIETKDGTVEKAVPIADFSAWIVEEMRGEYGEVTFKVEGKTIQGRSFTVEIESEKFSDDGKLKAALERGAGAKAPVLRGMAGHLNPAIKRLSSENVKQTRQYNRTGWAGDTFLLPGREPEGVTIKLHNKLVYSAGSDDVDAGLKGLAEFIKFAGPGLASVLISHVLIPPMARLLGLHNRRSGLAIKGETGTLKTSTCQVLMSFYGSEFMENENLARFSGGASVNALRAMAAESNDMPFFVDNYKPNTGGGQKDLVDLTHTLIEGGEKDRMKRNAELRETKPIFSWPIITGEDFPENESSTLARYLLIEFSRPTIDQKRHLSRAQEAARAGHLAALGTEWIKWLETDNARQIISEHFKGMDDTRARWSEFLQEHHPNMQNPSRVATTLAINELALQVAALHPQLGEAIGPLPDAHRAELEKLANRMGNYTSASSPAHRFLEGLSELVVTGRGVIIAPGAAGDQQELQLSHGNEARRILGWSDGHGGAYLSPMIVIKEVENLIGPLHVSSNELYNQLAALGAIGERDRRGGKSLVQKKIRGKNRRVLHIVAEHLRLGSEE